MITKITLFKNIHLLIPQVLQKLEFLTSHSYASTNGWFPTLTLVW